MRYVYCKMYGLDELQISKNAQPFMQEQGNNVPHHKAANNNWGRQPAGPRPCSHPYAHFTGYFRYS
jgi:hypothetical protein